jgi:hypothetical protein
MAEAPRVVGGTVGVGLGGGKRAQLGRVGASEDDEPGSLELAGEVRVVRRARLGVAQHARSEVDRIALHGAQEVLHQEGDAGEGRAPRGHGPRLRARGLETLMDHRVQLRVEPRDARDRGLGQVEGAHLAATEQLRLGRGIETRELVDHRRTLRRGPGEVQPDRCDSLRSRRDGSSRDATDASGGRSSYMECVGLWRRAPRVCCSRS